MENIITAVLALLGKLVGSYFATRKSTALIPCCLEALENKVKAHNNLVEHIYKLEEHAKFQEEKLKVVNHRIQDLERSA